MSGRIAIAAPDPQDAANINFYVQDSISQLTVMEELSIDDAAYEILSGRKKLLPHIVARNKMRAQTTHHVPAEETSTPALFFKSIHCRSITRGAHCWLFQRSTNWTTGVFIEGSNWTIHFPAAP